VLQTLGKLRLQGSDFSRPVPLLILCYLTYEGGRHHREDLAEFLFPFSPPDETTLSNQAQQIVDAIYEVKLSGRSVNIQLPSFSRSALNSEDLTSVLQSAHQLLKLNGFITDASIIGVKGSYCFTYKLTPSFFIQCKGLDPLGVSLNKLKSHLQHLSSIQPTPISRNTKFVESLTRLDLHRVREWMRRDEVDDAFEYAPFLDRIENHLIKEKYQLGVRLADWIERTRLEVASELTQHFANRAVEVIANDPLKAQRFALTALNIGKSAGTHDADYEPIITVLSRTGYTFSDDTPTHYFNPTSHPELYTLPQAKCSMPRRLSYTRHRAWLLSKEHLGSLVEFDTDSKDETVSSAIRGKYNAETYVETTDDQHIREFVLSEKKCLLVLGKSGTGKSSLLCHNFLENQSGSTTAVFLSARLFTTPDFETFLRERVWKELYRESVGVSHKTSVTLYIDAVNEFSYAGNPVMLLRSILKYIQDIDNVIGPKIILSCRIETWREYLEVYPLGPRGVDVLNISGFNTATAKAELYHHYQRFYHLHPAKYTSLSADVTQLIETPFLMRMIAETYSNRSTHKGLRKIPKQLNFFEVFMLLTEYKREDALRLLAPTEPKRTLFDEALQQCLLAFATVIYKKVTGSMLSEGAKYDDTTDAVDASYLNDTQFATYMCSFSEVSSISPFQALIQLNLIAETTVTNLNFWGRPTSTVAYKFFHDQYTQFWLAAVLGESVLGSFSSSSLHANEPQLILLGDKLSKLLGEAGQTPLIAGAVEHWLHANILAEGPLAFPIPLLDLLASKESGAVFYYIASFLHGLIEKNVVSPKRLYKLLFRDSGPALKVVLANHLLELWPNISKRHLTAFMASLDNERDSKVLRTLSDNFVELFNLYPNEVVRLLDSTLKGGEDFPKALKNVIVSRSEAFSHAAFVTNFASKAIISNATSLDRIRLVRDFLERKYRLLLDALISKQPGVLMVLQKFLYRRLEELGVNQWNQAVGVQGENNRFFVEHKGVVQQELLQAFYPYMVAIHNRDFREIKFDGGDFERMTLAMLGFEPGSVIGYEAAMMTAAALAENLVAFEDVVDKLLQSNNQAHLFFLNLITSVYAYMDTCKTSVIMEALEHKIVPHLAAHHAYPEKILGGILGVTAIDFASSRQQCEAILDFISQDVKCSGDVARRQELTNQLVNCIFHPNIETAQFLVGYVMKRQWLDDTDLSACGMGVLVGVFVRNTSVLNSAIASLDNYDHILRDVKQSLTKDLYTKRDNMVYQTIWNRFMSSAFKTPKLRYYLIKILTGGLLQSNNVREYALEFRRLLVEMLCGYVTETSIDYTYFTVEEAMRETEPKYVKGTGELWVY
jgi:hypothetical protein